MPLDIVCPKCHRIFSREVEEKEVLEENFVRAPERPSMSEDESIPASFSRPSVGERVVTYRYHYRCKHCGHEWTDVKEEEDKVSG